MAPFELHPDAVWIPRPDRSSRLLHFDGNACGLDADSTTLLHAILHRGVADASAELAARARIPADEARADVEDFVCELRRQRILREPGAGAAHLERIRSRAAVVFVRLGLVLFASGARPRAWRVWGLLLTARSAIGLFGWAKTRAAWEGACPLSAGGGRTDGPDLPAVADEVVRRVASRSLLHHQCKERALACLATARRMGLPSNLVIGLSYTPLRAHVWVEADGRIISDDPEHCAAFEPIGLAGSPAPASR